MRHSGYICAIRLTMLLITKACDYRKIKLGVAQLSEFKPL
jgi:hypothetical protein